MIRVGFALYPSGAHWIGGHNYFRNLLQALTDPPQIVVPVALVGARDDVPKDFPRLETYETRSCRRNSELLYLRKIVQKASGRDWILEHTLHSASVDVLSHSGSLGKFSRVPTIDWIPDFQHIHYPNFFSSTEVHSRNRFFNERIKNATLVVVSREVPRKHLEQFAHHGARKCRFLHFTDSSA
jgi:hypothetical protein